MENKEARVICFLAGCVGVLFGVGGVSGKQSGVVGGREGERVRSETTKQVS